MRGVVQAPCWWASWSQVLALRCEHHRSSAAHAEGAPSPQQPRPTRSEISPLSGSSDPRIEVGWWALIAGGLPPHGSSGRRGVPVQASAGVARGREQAGGGGAGEMLACGPWRWPGGASRRQDRIEGCPSPGSWDGGRPPVDCDSTSVRGGLRSEFEVSKHLLKSVLNIGAVD